MYLGFGRAHVDNSPISYTIKLLKPLFKALAYLFEGNARCTQGLRHSVILHIPCFR